MRTGQRDGSGEDPRGAAGAARVLRALAAVALWTLAFAYLLPPGLGGDAVRLAAYAGGALAACWLAGRLWPR